MAFGQQSGPPATHRQVQTLLELLEDAGHADFRDARGPMGFTQRQAGGNFTRDEADEFIEQLEAAQHEGTQVDETQPQESVAPAAAKPTAKLSAADRAIRRLSTDDLAAELQRRGWIVLEP